MRVFDARRWLCSAAILSLGFSFSAAHAQTLPGEDQTEEDGQSASAPDQAVETTPARPLQTGAQLPADSTNTTDDIVVTATRRSTLLDETPMAISVVSADTLERDNIETITDLNGRLPSLLIGQSFGGSRIAIRGIGFNPIRPGDEGRVAYYTDGVYVARPSAQIGTLFDIERMEVLRGPQGTLYGRNATGGALLVSTRDPTDELTGYLNGTVGNYDLLRLEGAVGGPLLRDKVSARLAFQKVDRDGYWDNLITGNDVGDADTFSARGTVLIEPSPAFLLRVTADVHQEDDRNYVIHNLGPGFVPLPDGFSQAAGSPDVAQPFDPKNDVDSWGASATANWLLSETLTLTGIVGYRDLEADLLVHGSGHGGSYSNFKDDSEQYVAELQLTGEVDAFEWIVGGSWFNEDQQPQLRSAIIGQLFFPLAPNFLVQGTNSSANLLTDAYAVFGELVWNVTDKLSFTGGIRYSWETKQALNEFNSLDLFTPYPAPESTDNGFIPRPPRPGFPRDSEIEFDAWTPRFAVNYEFTPDLSAYATYVEGFKSGGFNYGTIQDPYQPETISNYEAGLRARLGRFLTVRGAVFHYDYQNLQQTVQIPELVGTFVLNTGDARIRGAELEFVARPVPAFQIDGNLGVLDTRFGSFVAVDPNRGVTENIEGNEIPQAPDYTLYLGAQYEHPVAGGLMTLRGDYRRLGETEFDIFNNAPLRQDAYDVIGANLTFERENWKAQLWGQNLGNTFAVNSQALQANALGGNVAGTLIPPRTYGLTVGYKF